MRGGNRRLECKMNYGKERKRDKEKEKNNSKAVHNREK